MRAAWGEARAASCSPAAALASSPGAAAPGRPHYAGGLPAAAMASRAVVRAGHSPQRFLVRAAVAAPARAAFPLSRSYPLPFRSNSSSTSFPSNHKYVSYVCVTHFKFYFILFFVFWKVYGNSLCSNV